MLTAHLTSSGFLLFKRTRKLKSENERNTDRDVESAWHIPPVEAPSMLNSSGIVLGQPSVLRGTSLPFISRPSWLNILSSSPLSCGTSRREVKMKKKRYLAHGTKELPKTALWLILYMADWWAYFQGCCYHHRCPWGSVTRDSLKVNRGKSKDRRKQVLDCHNLMAIRTLMRLSHWIKSWLCVSSLVLFINTMEKTEVCFVN